MRPLAFRALLAIATCALLLTGPASATDVDGPDDCQRAPIDWGDAPETARAYLGIPGKFPTCSAPGPTGTQELACAPISTAPGPAGFVQHQTQGPGFGYWLGCDAAGGPALGIDPEADGKMNDSGAPASDCDASIGVDCVEVAFGLNFGQDECYGSDDAAIANPVTFTTCEQGKIDFLVYNCEANPQTVTLNVLVDWNQDGDWNDNFQCAQACAYEWAVKNAVITIPAGPGCFLLTSPLFLIGPNAGEGWMRLTISDDPVTDDFPWNGSAAASGEILRGGETEDYPVTIVAGDPCPAYRDYGDAPEDVQAYVGKTGHFPTCTIASAPGTAELDCNPISTPPGPTGYVLHERSAGDALAFWLGCAPTFSVDGELDGKTNDTGGNFSVCNPNVAVDCIETAFGLDFGQDECYGDTDAGISLPVSFEACSLSTVRFDAFNCSQTTVQVVVNVLIDWNGDGDWNDNFLCPSGCAYEWAVKNRTIGLAPGCNTILSPQFVAGPFEGEAWMRVTLTPASVNDDFPWAGVATMADPRFRGGETEDYPVTITIPQDPCPSYQDFGDAPEEFQAYPGVPGNFPTCKFGGGTGTQELNCTEPARSTPPLNTGYVEHRRTAFDPFAVWLGCGDASIPHPGVDGETDAKSNDDGLNASRCDPNVIVDCFESAFGLDFGQDECYGDEDAGIEAALTFTTCEPATVTFEALNCGDTTQDVYLNVLVDWNQDGDWNDNFLCPNGCAHEWAVKNAVINVDPGCKAYTSPAFLAGPTEGNGWLRITLSRDPAPDDFPWNGSLSLPGEVFQGGETEDYPVTIEGPDPCAFDYTDFGDAPEEVEAYPNVAGLFPTCLLDTGPAAQTIACGVPQSTPPGAIGFVKHVGSAADPSHFWLGCGVAAQPEQGLDSELDAKMNNDGNSLSACGNELVDCIEPAFGFDFGQDECYGDRDAGIDDFVFLPRCSLATITFEAFSCVDTAKSVFLNVLVDWTRDGDWNDNALCSEVGHCAPEWAVKNAQLLLNPGCGTYNSPSFRVGSIRGASWMRVTISQEPAPDDFPWNGTKGFGASQAFRGGETEDYPVEIIPSLVDAPENGPRSLHLAPPMPNPTTGLSTIRFTLPRETAVRLEAFDLAGRRVRTLLQSPLGPGEHAVPWNLRDDRGVALPAGVYVVKLTAGDRELTQRIVRLR